MRKPNPTQRKAAEAAEAITAYVQAFQRSNPTTQLPVVRWERGWVMIRDRQGHMPGSYRLAQLRVMTERLNQRSRDNEAA